jgi:O-antigen/teichoic acid export membrane protein
MEQPHNISRLRELFRRWVTSPEDRYVVFDTTASLAAQVVSMFVQFAMVRMLVRGLGEEGYGLWATITSTVAVLGLLQIGIGPNLVNALSAVPKDEPNRARHIIASALAIQVTVALVGVALSVGVVKWIDLARLFPGVRAEFHTEIVGAALVLAIGGFVRLPTIVPGYVYRSRLQGYRDSLIQVVSALFYLAGAYLALLRTKSLTLVALAQQASQLLYGVISTVAFFWNKPELTPRLQDVQRKMVREFLTQGTHLSIVSVAAYVVISSDNLVISQVIGVEQVAPYAATMTLAQIGQRVTLRILDACWPLWARAAAENRLEWLRSHYARTNRWIALITFLNAALVLVLGPFLIRVWTGSDRVVPSPSLLIAMTALFVAQGLSTAPGRFAVAMGNMSLASRVSIANAVVNLAASLVLARWYGTAGVAWGTVIGYVTTCWAYFAFARRKLNG